MKYEIESRRQLLLQRQQQQVVGEEYFIVGNGAIAAGSGGGSSIRRHSSASQQHQSRYHPSSPALSFFSPNDCDDNDDDNDYENFENDEYNNGSVGAVDDENNNSNDDNDASNYYSVNLRSFTGTLRVCSRSSQAPLPPPPRGWNQGMLSSAIAKQNATTQLTASSIPTTSKTTSTKCIDNDDDDDDDDINNNNNDNIEVVLEQEERGQRRRSVRFSLPPGKEEKEARHSVIHASTKNDEDVLTSPPPPPPPSYLSSTSYYPSPTPSSGSSVQQQQQQQQPPPKKPRISFLHSPPLFSYASPPRNPTAKAKTIARETSTFLARSSKHVLRQVTLAGKDAYDIVLNGEDRLGGSSMASSLRYSISSSAKKRESSCLEENDNDDSDDDDDDSARDNNWTELHRACASQSLAHIRALLHDDSGSVGGEGGNGGSINDLRKCDRKGRLPLHIFVNNRSLIESNPKGCEEVVLAMIDSMGGPDVIVRNADALSSCGLIPFVYVLGSWVDRLHRGAMTATTTTTTTFPTPLGGGRGASILEDDKPRVELDAVAQSLVDGNTKSPSSSMTPEKVASSSISSTISPSRRRVTYRSLLPSSSSANNALSKLQYIPASVAISVHERWAIRILSRLIDEHVETTREAILTNVASVPLFLKSVLLIDDTEAMTEVLNSSLVRHAALDKRSINVWLCSMLTNTKEVKIRAVTFLKLLSRLTLADLASSSQSPDRFSAKEMERFTMLQEETFNAVYVMPGFVPAVLELGGLTIENISTTSVMRYITDRTIRKESVFFVLILDFFYSLFLLMGYRLNVEFILFYQDVNGPEYYNEHSYISTSIRGIAGYFFIKEALTLLSLYMTSTKLAKRYCMSVFNIIDFASVAMLLLTEGALTTNPNLIDNEGFTASLTVILLWLKLMGAFKILNSAFALFLYAVDEVMKKVKWFLLFLFMITFMFSDAARTIVAARGDCRGRIDMDMYLMDEFCSDSLFSIVVRMYSVVVGDVNLQDFQSSNAMVAIFVLFTFFSIIIILNILIAIIIDSYQGSKKVRL
jgi:hypothetical protein